MNLICVCARVWALCKTGCICAFYISHMIFSHEYELTWICVLLRSNVCDDDYNSSSNGGDDDDENGGSWEIMHSTHIWRTHFLSFVSIFFCSVVSICFYALFFYFSFRYRMPYVCATYENNGKKVTTTTATHFFKCMHNIKRLLLFYCKRIFLSLSPSRTHTCILLLLIRYGAYSLLFISHSH